MANKLFYLVINKAKVKSNTEKKNLHKNLFSVLRHFFYAKEFSISMVKTLVLCYFYSEEIYKDCCIREQLCMLCRMWKIPSWNTLRKKKILTTLRLSCIDMQCVLSVPNRFPKHKIQKKICYDSRQQKVCWNRCREVNLVISQGP